MSEDTHPPCRWQMVLPFWQYIAMMEPDAATCPDPAPFDAVPAPPDAEAPASFDAVLDGIGPRLKRLRQQRGSTLAALAQATGISISTLSRLESGGRRPSLELLLPIARAHKVPLDELVGESPVDDPRIRAEHRHANGMLVLPLSRQPGGLQAFKITLPATKTEPERRTHEGCEWLYVLGGRLRLILANHDLSLGAGEAAEFDTRMPHWLGTWGDGPVEMLCLFSAQGERVHLRVRPRRKGEAAQQSRR